uniref:Putative secreted peptide n=1 Tax=Anopheles braziliensis TaxID=58242 RepID=A0A2M3ZMW0_9DIPT
MAAVLIGLIRLILGAPAETYRRRRVEVNPASRRLGWSKVHATNPDRTPRFTGAVVVVVVVRKYWTDSLQKMKTGPELLKLRLR